MDIQFATSADADIKAFILDEDDGLSDAAVALDATADDGINDGLLAVGGVLPTVMLGDVWSVPNDVPSFGFTVKYHWSPDAVALDGTVKVSLYADTNPPFLYHLISLPVSKS